MFITEMHLNNELIIVLLWIPNPQPNPLIFPPESVRVRICGIFVAISGGFGSSVRALIFTYQLAALTLHCRYFTTGLCAIIFTWIYYLVFFSPVLKHA